MAQIQLFAYSPFGEYTESVLIEDVVDHPDAVQIMDNGTLFVAQRNGAREVYAPGRWLKFRIDADKETENA